MTSVSDLDPSSDEAPTRSLSGFTGAGYDKGRNVLWQAAWFATSYLVFQKWWLPARFRPAILRAFGATVGRGVLIRHGVRVHWPWKLTIGDDCWIGEDAWLLSVEPIVIGHDVCISQQAFICAGSHDPSSSTLEYDNAPITIEAGAWVTARAIVLRGTTVAAHETVPANSVRSRSSRSSKTR